MSSVTPSPLIGDQTFQILCLEIHAELQTEESLSEERLKKFYQSFFELTPGLKRRVFERNQLLPLVEILKATPSSLSDQQIELIEWIVKCYQSAPITLKRRPSWKGSLVTAMQYCRLALEMSHRPDFTHRLQILASQLIVRFIKVEVLADPKVTEEITDASFFAYQENWRSEASILDYLEGVRKYINSPEDHQEVIVPLSELISNGFLNDPLNPYLAPYKTRLVHLSKPTPTGIPYNITETYPNKISEFRIHFMDLFRRIDETMRDKQQLLTDLFCTFLGETILSEAMNILGPPPCRFDLLAMGSIGREEVTTLSDLECVFLIEDDKPTNTPNLEQNRQNQKINSLRREYFLKCGRLLEFLISAFGETFYFDVPSLASSKQTRPQGFHLDPTKGAEDLTGNDPESNILIATIPQLLEIILKPVESQSETSVSRFPDREYLKFRISNTDAYTLLKSKSVIYSCPSELFIQARRAILKLLKTPLSSQNKFYRTQGERIVHHTLQRRINEFSKPSLAFPTLIDLKKLIIGPLTLLITDLHLYFCDSKQLSDLEVEESPVNMKTNTLDLINELDEVFTKESRDLLTWIVSELYAIRVRLHDSYGPDKGEQKDLAAYHGEALNVTSLLEREKKIVNCTFWLVLTPLYSHLSKSLALLKHKDISFQESMQNLSLPDLIAEELIAKHQEIDKPSKNIYFEKTLQAMVQSPTSFQNQFYAYLSSSEAATKQIREEYISLLSIHNVVGYRQVQQAVTDKLNPHQARFEMLQTQLQKSPIPLLEPDPLEVKWLCENLQSLLEPQCPFKPNAYQAARHTITIALNLLGHKASDRVKAWVKKLYELAPPPEQLVSEVVFADQRSDWLQSVIGVFKLDRKTVTTEGQDPLKQCVDHIQTFRRSLKDRKYQMLNEALGTLAASYDHFIYAQKRAVCYGEGVGPSHLKPEALGYFFPESTIDVERAVVSTRSVHAARGMHFKENPSYPGVEFMTHSLNALISGEGASPPPTMFVKVTYQKATRCYLISKTVLGEGLGSIYFYYPDYLKLIDRTNLSHLVFLSLLSDPQNGNGDKYQVQLEWNGDRTLKRVKIIGINYDLSFAIPILMNSRGHIVDVKCMIYALPEMNLPIDKKAKNRFLALPPATTVVKWMQSLLNKNAHYMELRASGILTEMDLRECHLPILLYPDGVQIIYQKLIKLQSLLRNDINDTLTHNDLLRELQPLVYLTYQALLKKYANDPMKVMEALYIAATPFSSKGYTIEELLDLDTPLSPTETVRMALANQNARFGDFENDRTQTVEAALFEFVAALRLDALSPEDEVALINQLGRTQGLTPNLSLQRCRLGINDFEEALLRPLMGRLQTLTLRDCASLTDHDARVMESCYSLHVTRITSTGEVVEPSSPSPTSSLLATPSEQTSSSELFPASFTNLSNVDGSISSATLEEAGDDKVSLGKISKKARRREWKDNHLEITGEELEGQKFKKLMVLGNDELVWRIFSFLDEKTFFNVVPLVCRRWKIQHNIYIHRYIINHFIKSNKKNNTNSLAGSSSDSFSSSRESSSPTSSTLAELIEPSTSDKIVKETTSSSSSTISSSSSTRLHEMRPIAEESKSTVVELALNPIQARLIEFYRNQKSSSVFNKGENWLFHVDDIYTNLTIIGETEKKEKQQTEKSYEDRRIPSHETLYQPKTPIRIQDLFQQEKIKDSSKKRALIYGVAGVGKTTFSEMAAIHGSTLWSDQFATIFLIKLRNLNKENYPDRGQDWSIEEILAAEHRNSTISPEEFKAFLATESFRRQALLILDGFDELPREANSGKGGLKNIIRDFESTFDHMLITSRPGTVKFHYVTIGAQTELEIMGFDEASIDAYIVKFYTQIDAKEKIDRLHSLLKRQPILHCLVQIPINLTLACSLFNQDEEIFASEHSFSLTNFYFQTVNWLYRRFVDRPDISPLLPSLDPDQDLLILNLVADMDHALQLIAWQAMEQNTIQFKQQTITTLLKRNRTAFNNFERVETSLKKSGLIKFEPANNSWEFIHLTFQEYFAAHYLAHLYQSNDLESAAKELSRIKFNPRYTLTLWMIAGLLSMEEIRLIQTFFDHLFSLPRDLARNYERRLFAQCFEECENPARISQYDDFVKECDEYLNVANQSDTINLLNRNMQLIHHPEIRTTILLHLMNDENQSKQMISVLSSLVSNQQMLPIEFVYALVEIVKDPNLNEVRIDAALELLVEIGKMGRAIVPEAIAALVEMVQDPSLNGYVRASVAINLVEIGEAGIIPPDAIAALMEVTRDCSQDDYVREEAARALVEIGKGRGANAPEATAAWVRMILGFGSDRYVRRGALKALKIGGEAIPLEAITALVRIARDFSSKGDVRIDAALELLFEIGNEIWRRRGAIVPETIAALAGLVQDSSLDGRVRKLIAEEYVDKWEAEKIPSELIAALVEVVRDCNEDGVAKEGAVRALGEIGKRGRTIPQEAIAILIGIVQDFSVDIAASFTTSSNTYGSTSSDTAEQAKPGGMFTEEEDEIVKIADVAAEALRKIVIGGGTTTLEATTALVGMLQDSNLDGYVRLRIARDLVEMETGGGTIASKVLAALGEMTQDFSLVDYVRGDATLSLYRIEKERGTVSSETIFLLMGMVQNLSLGEHDRSNAADALREIGKEEGTIASEAIAALVEMLQDTNLGSNVRVKIAIDLIEIGQGGIITLEAIADLVKMLQDPRLNDYDRKKAAEALGQMEKRGKTIPQEAIAALVEMVQNSKLSDYEREGAVRALGEIGERGRTIPEEAIAALVEMVQNSKLDDPERAGAAGVLGKIMVGGGTSALEASAALVEMMQDSSLDKYFKGYAATILGMVGEKGGTIPLEAITALVRKAQGSDSGKRYAVTVLGMIVTGKGTTAPEAIAALVGMMQDSNFDSHVRKDAAEELVFRGKGEAIPPEEIAILIELVKKSNNNKYNFTRENALYNLEQMDNNKLISLVKNQHSFALVKFACQLTNKAFYFDAGRIYISDSHQQKFVPIPPGMDIAELNMVDKLTELLLTASSSSSSSSL